MLHTWTCYKLWMASSVKCKFKRFISDGQLRTHDLVDGDFGVSVWCLSNSNHLSRSPIYWNFILYFRALDTHIIYQSILSKFDGLSWSFSYIFTPSSIHTPMVHSHIHQLQCWFLSGYVHPLILHRQWSHILLNFEVHLDPNVA